MSISHLHRLRVLRFDDESSNRNYIDNDVNLKELPKPLVKAKKFKNIADRIDNLLKEEPGDFTAPSSSAFDRGSVGHRTVNICNAGDAVLKIRKHGKVYHKSNNGIYKIPTKRKMRVGMKNKQMFENKLNFDDVKRLISLKGNEYSEQFLNAVYRVLSKDKDHAVEMRFNKRKKLEKHRHKRNKDIKVLFARDRSILIKEVRKQDRKSRRRRVSPRPSNNIFQNSYRYLNPHNCRCSKGSVNEKLPKKSSFTLRRRLKFSLSHKLLKVKSAPNYESAVYPNRGLSKKTINMFRKDNLFTSSSVFPILISPSDQQNLGRRGVYFGAHSFKKVKQYNPGSSSFSAYRKLSDNLRMLCKCSSLFTDNNRCWCNSKKNPVASSFSLYSKESGDQKRPRKQENLNKPFPDNPVSPTPRKELDNQKNFGKQAHLHIDQCTCNASDDQKNSRKQIKLITNHGEDKQVGTSSSIFRVLKKENRVSFKVSSCRCSRHNLSIFPNFKKELSAPKVNKRGNYKGRHHFPVFRTTKKGSNDQKNVSKCISNTASQCDCSHHKLSVFHGLKRKSGDKKKVIQRISSCECPYYHILSKHLTSMKDCLKYILFVLVIIAWSPCIVAISLWRLVTSLFKLHGFKEKDNTSELYDPNECKCFRTHKTHGTLAREGFTTEVYNERDYTRKYNAKGDYTTYNFWTDIINRAKHAKRAIVSLFGSICCYCFSSTYERGSQCYVLSEKKTKTNEYPQLSSPVPPPRTSTPRAYRNLQFNEDPNPKKKYKLFYSGNRGWLIKPICTRFDNRHNHDVFENNTSPFFLKKSPKAYFCGDPYFSKDYRHATTKIPSYGMKRPRCIFKRAGIQSSRFNSKCPMQRTSTLMCQDNVSPCMCFKRSCKQRFIKCITYPVRRLKRMIDDVEKQAVPKVDPCKDAFLFSLRKRPNRFSQYIYNNYPNFYSCCIITSKSCQNLINVLLGCLCICVWSPIVCSCYVLYQIFCLICML